MRRLLLINPNTSASVDQLLLAHARSVAASDVHVHVRGARFGAPYIASEATFAVAEHAVLDAWAAALTPDAERFDAVVIGCFGDPGLFALRELSAVPVTGLAEASLQQAAALGRFAIVTGGARWAPMLQRLAAGLGLASGLAVIHTVEATGAEMAADPLRARALLAEACRTVVRQHDVRSVIVGGAGLAGMAAELQSEVPCLLIDSVTAAVQQAQRGAQPETLQPRQLFDFSWQQVAPELQALQTPRVPPTAA